MNLFSVHDSKAQTYLNPMTFRTSAEAIRAFETTCKDSKSQFNMYPADFTLVQVGEFSPEHGTIVPLDKPHILCNASNFVQ